MTQIKEKMAKCLIFSMLSLFLSVGAAYATVCFLPDSDNCSDPDIDRGNGNCDGYTDSKKSEEGWICIPCPSDSSLYKCTPRDCPTGYSTTVMGCAKGFKPETKGKSGDDDCKKCVPDDCPGNTSVSKICSDPDDVAVPTEHYSGDNVCYQCLNDKCPELTYKSCADDEEKRPAGKTEAGTQCYFCGTPCSDECTDAGASTQEVNCARGYESVTVTPTQCGNTCYKCEKSQCKEGYGTNEVTCVAPYEKVCDGYSGSDACCKCEKPCHYTETEDKSAYGYDCDSCERDGATYYSCTCNKEYERPNDDSNVIKCYDCEDEADHHNPCYGKYHCKGGARLPVGDVVCSCPYRNTSGVSDRDVKYYENCLVQEICEPGDTLEENGGKCVAYDEEDATAVYGAVYKVKEKCQRITSNNKVYYYAECATDNSKDCNGNYSPVRGKKKCPNNKGTNPVQCGYFTYFDECEEECNAGDILNENGGRCEAFDTTDSKVLYGALYMVKDKCQRTTSDSAVKYYAECTTGDAKDCNGNYSPVRGKKKCPNDKGTNPVKCGTDTYFDECEEECESGDVISANGGQCKSYDETDTKVGYGTVYFVKNKCNRTTSSSKVNYYAECATDDSRDCNGNYSPVRGLKKCVTPNNYPYGRTVKCGYHTYAEECYGQCPYNDSAESCAAKGMSFVRKCGDEKGKDWGVCE